jgi:ABC-type Co2+ transport system permease subunit
MSIIGVWAGYAVFLLVRKIMPKKKVSIAIAAAAAGFLSVPAAAAGFVFQYAIGATATYETSTVFVAMISTHLLIGIGEAIITFLTVSAVLASRSDLVFGYKSGVQELEIRS